MVWQDYVISIAQIGFIIALIPSLHGQDKPAKFTSFMNSGLLGIMSFCLFTLDLYFSAATAFGVTVIWAMLGLQKTRIDKNKK